jgi:hypothetical protein
MNDQHVATIATIVQDFLLFINLVVVGLYLCETWKMRRAAEKQVIESQELVTAAQKQLGISQEQIRLTLQEAEAQIRPAIAIRVDSQHHRFLAENVGNGPAVDLRFLSTAVQSNLQWDSPPNVQTILNGSFLPVGERPPEDVSIARAGSRDVEMQIMYKGLSGNQYFTVIRFDGEGRPSETRFGVR